MHGELVEKIIQNIDRQRLVDTALALIEVPSPTCSAGKVADLLAEMLAGDGFAVERPVADWPEAPAVAVRFDTGKPGQVLQFDGHLDTVHLPFVPARCEDGHIYGTGASDMKGGIAAFVEALRVLRETDALQAGGILLTAHDHHEGPWGDKRQVKALIREGYCGDGVLLPEYLADQLPLAGRGQAVFQIRIQRDGVPVHEVLRPEGQPDVLTTGAELVVGFRALATRLKENVVVHAGHDSIFVGHFTCGEIYNQSPVECFIEGTRRWATPGTKEGAREEFEGMLEDMARESGTRIEADYEVQGDAYSIDPGDPLVEALQQAHQAVTSERLPVGGKPFVDDGNWFVPLGGIPSVTHGPAATGAHSVYEKVAVAELVRVAKVYALTAVNFCSQDE